MEWLRNGGDVQATFKQAVGSAWWHGIKQRKLIRRQVRLPTALGQNAPAPVPVSQRADCVKAQLTAKIRHLVRDHVLKPDLGKLPTNNG